MKLLSPQRGKAQFLGAVVMGLSLISALPAQADEVWNSDYGNVVYQADRGNTAIWTYGDSVQGTLFIEGLVGNLNNRGTYYGYWSQSTSKVRCETYREGRDGSRSYYWGTLRLQFLDAEFPARWSAVTGYCNQYPTTPWRGFPLLGGSPAPFKLP